MITWTNHRRQVKLHAKRSLVGNFLKGVLAALITFGFSVFALSFVPLKVPDTINATNPQDLFMSMIPEGDIKITLQLMVIAFLLYILLTAPLSIGKNRFYLQAVRGGKKPSFKTFFSAFTSLSEIFSSCVLVVISALWIAIMALVLLLPAAALMFLAPNLGPLAQNAGLVLYFAAILALLILSTPCIMAPFFLADKPELGAFRSLILAYKQMRGVKRELLVFDLSFALWRLLFGMSAPGAFFIEPYITASMAGFYISMDACKK